MSVHNILILRFFLYCKSVNPFHGFVCVCVRERERERERSVIIVNAGTVTMNCKNFENLCYKKKQ
jgi:hypothetical protein